MPGPVAHYLSHRLDTLSAVFNSKQMSVSLGVIYIEIKDGREGCEGVARKVERSQQLASNKWSVLRPITDGIPYMVFAGFVAGTALILTERLTVLPSSLSHQPGNTLRFKSCPFVSSCLFHLVLIMSIPSACQPQGARNVSPIIEDLG